MDRPLLRAELLKHSIVESIAVLKLELIWELITCTVVYGALPPERKFPFIVKRPFHCILCYFKIYAEDSLLEA